MNKDFHIQNRRHLYDLMLLGSVFLCFSGEEVRKTNDEHYPFYADRNFLYLTGIEQKKSILLAVKTDENSISESLYILPPDPFAERWTGRRLKAEEVSELSGIERVLFLAVLKRTSIHCLLVDTTAHARQTVNTCIWIFSVRRSSIVTVLLRNSFPSHKKNILI